MLQLQTASFNGYGVVKQWKLSNVYLLQKSQVTTKCCTCSQ